MLRQVSRIARLSSARGYASTRPAFGGVVTQVIGAVVDVKVGSLNPCFALDESCSECSDSSSTFELTSEN